jgi:thioredoxin-related protein
MKKLLMFTFAVTMMFQAYAQINFEHGSWAEVKAKAKKENKMIFVDAFTTWCGPCKWMAANTFTDKSVGEYYNANFINYKFDMEKGEGTKFANDYQIQAYPSLLYLKADGAEIFRSEGSVDGESFLEMGKSVLSGGLTNPTEEIEEVTEEVSDTPDWNELNNKAWGYYESETNKAKLEEACGWALQSIELNKNFYNTDTYAHLLYKLGKKQDALQWAKVAVELGENNGEDVGATKELIQKIKSNK